MASVTSERLQDLQDELEAVNLQITALQTAMIASSTGTKSYVFDSGTGRQQEIFNNPLEIKRTLDQLYATRYSLRLKLSGQAIQTVRLRR